MEGVFGRTAGWRKPFLVHQEVGNDSKRAAHSAAVHLRDVLTHCDSQVCKGISPRYGAVAFSPAYLLLLAGNPGVLEAIPDAEGKGSCKKGL